MSNETLPQMPVPKRPENGLLAWQATMGYISSEHSPDALLTFQATPNEGGLAWSGTITWMHNSELVNDKPSLPAAMRDLWKEVTRSHHIFNSFEAAVRQPINYRDDQWLDADTQGSLDRLLQTTAAVFGDDWKLVMVYQPVEAPALRVQVRLLARNNVVHIGGRGASLRDACRELYRNAAKDFRQFK